MISYMCFRSSRVQDTNDLQGSNLLGVEEQKLALLLTNVFNIYFGAGGEGNVDTITLSQLNGLAADVDLDCSASGWTGVVARLLDNMGIDVGALGGVREQSTGREDGSEDVKWRVYGGRTCRLALINYRLAVLDCWCYDMCPLVCFVFIGETPRWNEIRGLISLCRNKNDHGGL